MRLYRQLSDFKGSEKGIALAIGFSWLNIWNITRKMEGSYYDKTV